MVDAFGFIADLAPWPRWMPFALAIQQAPWLPGVHLARRTATGPLVYVGMAGERGQGIKGRLTVYYRGKAAGSVHFYRADPLEKRRPAVAHLAAKLLDCFAQVRNRIENIALPRLPLGQ